MPEKLYKKLIALILALGMLITGALVAYTVALRSEVSIIRYIAGEVW